MPDLPSRPDLGQLPQVERQRLPEVLRSELFVIKLVIPPPAIAAPRGPVAQLAEQQTLNLLVLGSTPSGLTTFPRFF